MERSAPSRPIFAKSIRAAGVPRIVRRGITYGKREKEPQDNPSLEELPAERRRTAVHVLSKEYCAAI